MKICTNCNRKLEFSKFSRKTNSPDGYRTKCKDCHNEYCRLTWYPKNKEKQKNSSREYKSKNKIKLLSNKYNVDKEILEKAFGKGECEICNSNVFLVVDHDHKTNEYRGVICEQCNKGLGFFRDNIDFLQKAILYLNN